MSVTMTAVNTAPVLQQKTAIVTKTGRAISAPSVAQVWVMSSTAITSWTIPTK